MNVQIWFLKNYDYQLLIYRIKLNANFVRQFKHKTMNYIVSIETYWNIINMCEYKHQLIYQFINQ